MTLKIQSIEAVSADVFRLSVRTADGAQNVICEVSDDSGVPYVSTRPDVFVGDDADIRSVVQAILCLRSSALWATEAAPAATDERVTLPVRRRSRRKDARAWTDLEDQQLRSALRSDSNRQIAAMKLASVLGRTQADVKQRMHVLQPAKSLNPSTGKVQGTRATVARTKKN